MSDSQSSEINIEDDGDGFPKEILSKIGEYKQLSGLVNKHNSKFLKVSSKLYSLGFEKETVRLDKNRLSEKIFVQKKKDANRNLIKCIIKRLEKSTYRANDFYQCFAIIIDEFLECSEGKIEKDETPLNLYKFCSSSKQHFIEDGHQYYFQQKECLPSGKPKYRDIINELCFLLKLNPEKSYDDISFKEEVQKILLANNSSEDISQPAKILSKHVKIPFYEKYKMLNPGYNNLILRSHNGEWFPSLCDYYPKKNSFRSSYWHDNLKNLYRIIADDDHLRFIKYCKSHNITNKISKKEYVKLRTRLINIFHDIYWEAYRDFESKYYSILNEIRSVKEWEKNKLERLDNKFIEDRLVIGKFLEYKYEGSARLEDLTAEEHISLYMEQLQKELSRISNELCSFKKLAFS